MTEEKGKRIFTSEEHRRIIALVKELEAADSAKQKGIRDKLRKIGLYWSEVTPPRTKYTVANLDKQFKDGILKLTDSEKAYIGPSTQSIVLEELRPALLRPIKVSRVQGLEQYREAGFEGFMPISMLHENTFDIPNEPGVYVVIRTSNSEPQFLEEGTGAYRNGNNPNVSVEELRANYVEDAHTVYIGKAGVSLRKRVGQLLRFGKGSAAGHWGGRYLWQLADAEQLYVAWKTTPGCDPRIIEAQMIQDFVSLYGKRPFANLKD